MQGNRRTIVRAVGVLAALLVAAGAISPAMSAAPLTKAKVRKIAKKVAKQQINALVPGMISSTAVSKANYVIFKETLSYGQEKTLATNGPLSLVAECRQAGGNDIAEVVVRSTASNWWTTNANEYNAPGEARMHYNTETTGQEDFDTSSDEPAALAASGGLLYYIGLDDYKLGFGLNIFGHNCIFTGSAVVA